MRSFKIIVKNYQTEDGKSFTKASAKGKFIPLATANNETYYNVRFVGDEVKMPTKSGVYSVAFEDGGLWIDAREGFEEKNIVRVRAVKVVFDKNLTTIEK